MENPTGSFGQSEQFFNENQEGMHQNPQSGSGGCPDPQPANAGGTQQPKTTGRYIVILKDEGEGAKGIRESLSNTMGLKDVTFSSDYKDGTIAESDLNTDKTLFFDKLGIMVVSEEEALQQLNLASADADSNILAIEPEYLAYLTADDFPYEYLRGYRDAVNQLYEKITAKSGAGDSGVDDATVQAIFNDTAQYTWGLQAVRAHTSTKSGAGVRVAVLDTGFDLGHPDYAGRPITSRSFSGFPVQDIHGHGTHCIGTSCGPRIPATGVRRYGVAYGAQIFVGKVFNNNAQPSASTSNIIAGIEWAMTNSCRVVSLSLGAGVNQQILQYSVPIQRALNAGTLVIAAAGNNANRAAGNVGFVEPPANADAAMAVAAVDSNLRIANFSARSSAVTGVGGRVNVAGPGVSVFSSIPRATGRHAFFSGTSMATPHVAGVAALWCQATGLTGAALWNRLLQTSRVLGISALDVGNGLVQAPQ